MYTKWHHHQGPLLNPPQGQELSLMLSKAKPCTFLCKWEFDERWQSAVKSNGWAVIRSKARFQGIEWDEVLVALPDQAFRLKHLARLRENNRSYTLTEHIKLGILLGYSKEQVRHFVSRYQRPL